VSLFDDASAGEEEPASALAEQNGELPIADVIASEGSANGKQPGKQAEELGAAVEMSAALQGLQHEFGGAGAESRTKEGVDAEEPQEAEIAAVYNSLLSGCRSVNRYERLNRIDEGTVS
jgi:hypothetical protein